MAEDNIHKIFSDNLRKWLSRRDKTQADLYKRMGVSSSTAADWCTGKKMPRVNKIVEISQWLMIELTDLLEEGDRMPSEFENVLYRLHSDYQFAQLLKDINGLGEEDYKRVVDYVELSKGRQ